MGNNKRLEFQDDGNFVIYDGSQDKWAIGRIGRRFMKEEKLRIMHSPPFLMIDTDVQQGQVLWTLGGAILDEPELAYAGDREYWKILGAIMLNPGSYAVQAVTFLWSASWNGFSDKLKGNGVVADFVAGGIDRMANIGTTMGNGLFEL
jgi:hypothetical protein